MHIVIKALLIFGFLLVANYALGQSAGDYRSVNNGTWSVRTNWERYNGSVWNTPNPAQGYPGYNSIPGRVDINNNITLNLNPVNHIGNLYVNTGTLELSSFNLYVNGTTNITSTLSDTDPNGINFFYGPITVSNTGTWTSVTGYSDDLRIYGNIVNNSLNVSLRRLRVYSDIVLSGSGFINVTEYFEFDYNNSVTNQTHVSVGLGLNTNNYTGTSWINEGTLDYFSTANLLMSSNGILDASASGNTINYAGTGNQTVKTASSSYYNLSTSGSGTKTMVNDLVMGGNLNIGNSTTFSANSNDINIAGDWINNGSFSEGTGTVTFDGSTDQNISRSSNETFYNLIINNTGGAGDNAINLSVDVTCSASLGMISGNVNTGSGTLILTPSAAGSLNHVSGTIIGKFRRAVNVPTGSNYLFPVGTSTDYRPAIYNFSALASATNITGEFLQSSPDPFTPYTDGALSLEYAYTDGYWNFSSSSTPVAAYSLSLDGHGFSSYDIDTDTRISGRIAGNPDWQAFGTHGTFIPSTTVTRTGVNILNTSSFAFSLAGKCKPTANAGSDVTICDGSSTTLNGTGGVSYSWTPVSGLSDPNIRNPVASPSVTTTYTLTATRGVCVSSDNVIITVNPRPNPVITGNTASCPGKTNETYSTPEISGHSYDWSVTGGTFTGDGTHEIIIDWGPGPAGTVSVTETIDATGCSRTASINVNLLDVTPPVITCPSAILQNIDPGVCNASVVVPNAIISDNCSVASLTWVMAGATVAASPLAGINQVGTYNFNAGITSVTFTAKDIFGNEASCSFNVTITDNIDPAITCPANVVTTTSADGTGNCTTTATLGAPVTTDNCIVAGVIAQVSGTTINPATYLFPAGVTTVTWIVTDGSGRTSSCNQTVTVTDNENPAISCPANVVTTTSSDGTGNCTTTAALGVPVTTDNCSVASVIAQVSGATINPATYLFPTGATTVTWIVTDGSGRTANCNQTVTVTDNENPAITCPANVVTTTSSDGTGDCTTTATLGTPVTTDNCIVAGVVAQVGAVTINPATYLFPVGVTTVTWIVTDGSGRTATCIQTVTVTDDEDPAITCPANISHISDAGVCSYSVSPGVPVIADNCGGSTVVGTRNDSQLLTDPYPAGTTTIHWVVTDNYGNTNFCDQTITVTDNDPPSITCPLDISHTADAGLCSYTVSPGVPVTTDNCAVSTVVGVRSDSQLLTDPYPVGVTTIHWVVTDVHGNTNDCDQIVTVTDNEVPLITCPADISLDCEDDKSPPATGTATATDNCTPVASISITFSDGSTYNANPASLLHYNYVITRTWRATDIAGNSSQCIQTLTVHDVTGPAITCPAAVTIDCEDDNTPTGTGAATATDICTPVANISITFSDVSTYSADISNVLHYNYVITRTWRATDVAGNFSECVQTITVHDVTNPVIACPAAVTIDCEDDNTPAGTGTATATDVCTPVANITITFSDASTYSADPSSVLHYNYVITRTWRATDVAGNFSECIQTITVHDVTGPAITCPAAVTIDCEDDNTPVGTGTATATDICTPVANISITFSDVSTYSADVSNVLHYNYVITRTWRATDVAGNFSQCVQTITVHDVTNPVIACPAAVTIDCEDDNTPAGTGTATATDVCTPVANIAITFSDGSTFSADPSSVLHYNYVITRTWRATDVAGNFSQCVQTITVHDVTNPVITCPADVTIDCEDDNTPAGTGTATATDICTPVANISITFSDVSTYSADVSNLLHYNYVITRTWRATDVAGNFSQCVQTITVHDVTNPVIACPAAVTIDCEDDNTPAGTGTATATDVCTPVANIAITFSDGSTFSADPSSVLHYNYVITRTWRATDVAGNFSECVQTITVHDVTGPAITCPAAVTIDCEDDNTPAGTGTATATDICTPVANISITFSDVSTYSADVSNVLHYNYVITRTWRATDVAGNFSQCVQTITVHDVTNPVIACPAAVTIDCEDDNTPAGTGTATATDVCTPVANIAITFSDASTFSADPSSVLHYNYVITRTWRATDVAGNFSECIQTITVHDVTIPVITCPTDVTIDCEDDNTPTGTGTATATDICTPVANITITFSDASTYSADVSNLLHYNYVITRTWRATDVAGNFSQCIQTITVHDVTNPVITCPADVTIDCEDDNTPAGTGTATATDICTPVANIIITFSDVSTYSPDVSNVLHYNYVITRTWRATDVAGNFSECIQTITVHDVTSPAITCPAAVIIDCEDDNTPAGTGTATATDICTPIANISITFSDASTYSADPASVLHYNYVITRTWRATDVAGNFSECVQTITVHDVTSPAITCPAAITIDCEDDNTPTGTGTATATDICSPVTNISITFSDASTYSADPASVLHYNYVITRTWRATDVAGNFSECIQTITVHDVTNPVIACLADVTIDCEDDNTPTGTGTATATDICTPVANITITFSDASTYSADPSSVLHYNYVITRTWRATDVAGNFSECIQTITVHDITNPVIACPADVTIDCEDDNTPAGTGTATASDNCAPLANITINFSDVSTYSADPASLLHYNYVITRTWRATDVAGNFSECIQTITVHDVTGPVITCPAAVTIDCEDDNTPAGTGTATATDVCTPVANISITFSDASTYSADPSSVLHYNYVITRTWRATDVAGNFSECIQTITVHDVTSPVIACPADVTIDCEDDNTPTGTGTSTATDICTPVANISITFSDASTYSADPASVLHYNYIITRTWRATDVAGNFSECIQTITVHDVTNPVITCPADVTIDCEDDNTPAGTGTATATDICTPVANITITFGDASTYSADPASVLHYNYVITRTWRATDVSGNFSECIQTITVHDVTSPVITCPADVTIDCEDDNTPAGTGTATATDNCAPLANIAITFSDISSYSADVSNVLHYNYVITRTWRATDVSGNFSECIQTITVHDVTSPAITCPADVTIDCEDDNTPAGTGTATATDVCTPVANISITFSDASTYSADPASVLHYNYVITRTWRATDVAGNFSECIQTITVHDVTSPVIACPADVTIDCEDDNTPAGTGTATATDICTPVANIAITFSDASTYSADPSSVLHYNYVITRTWRATDVAGNFSECIQTITVHDVTSPVIACPTDVTIDCEDDNTPVGTGTATATDICTPVANISITFSDVSTYSADPASVLHYNYVIIRTWRATDVAGNFSECIQTITVHDITNPVITCPADVTIDCEDDNTPTGTGTATTTDNCTPPANITITFSDVSTYNADPSSVLHYNYVITRTWRATDVSGNFSECIQIITVHDVTSPVITCPADVTINCEDDNTPAGTGTATASDNCAPPANIAITFSDISSYSADVSNVLHYNYVITRTWRATDVAGNFSECIQTITVHDVTNPVITCPADVTIDCEDDNTPTGTGTATATDICTPVANIAITFSDASTYSADPASVLHYNYIITRTWRATDVAGNFSECIQTITVQDVTSPAITCPADVTIDCEDDNTPAGTGTATATDICTPVANISITFSDASTYSADPASVLHYNYVITRTWRATDVAGNFSECIQTITVHDVTNPVITCPADITIDCEDDNTPAGTGTATSTDICTPVANISITFSDASTYSADPASVLHYNYVITRTWRATDVAGNFSECIQIITVHDITNPVITCPADVTIDCEDDNTPAGTGTATASDNCAPPANITITFSDVSTYDADPASVLHYNYVITRTWRATDVAGNFSECVQTITVHDVTSPVIVCPADVTIDCEDDNTPAGTGTATATDNCAPPANITITFSDVSTYSADPASLLHYNYVITRTWRAIDVTGNFSECIQTITVNDVTSPVIFCPGNITVSCDADTGTATATDNCTPVSLITISFTDVSTYDPDPSNVLHYNYVITRTWRATDIAGNFSECIQTIIRTDVNKPAIICPVNVTINCEADNTPAGTGTATATDICTPVENITITFGDVSTYDADPASVLHYNYVITRTWRATDVAGNFSECVQTIIVHDVTNPVITCPADVTIDCEDDNTPSGTGTATASDNCAPPANITITFSDVSTYNADPASLLHYNYIITRTWRATDVAGNFSECIQTITVHDVTSPVIICPADVTIDCEDDNTPTGTGTATATDLCTPVANISITFSDASTYSADVSNVLHYNYVITRTWRATDVAGNFSECVQTITVHDITNPVITCPADVTIDCEDDNTPTGTGTATATDICTPVANISITFSDASTYSADPASVLHYNYVITRTWRATDVAGNFSECIQIITVHDVTNPVIACPADVTIDCEDDNTPSGTGTATATDICTPVANIAISFSDASTYSADPASVLHYNYVITRTWRATDVAGNFSECIQIITVHDVTSPVITCPADVTIDCEDDNTPAGTGTATASDNCAPPANIAITFSDVSTYSADPASVLHYNYVITRTWRATDVAGNFSECIQTITVHDVTNPVITCPADVTIDCEDDNTPTGTGTATATDICTPVANISITFSDASTYSADPASVLHYNYVITRTWRATDVAGNFSECIQIITVHDVTSPVITCPADVTIDCEDDNTPAGTGTATATDICTPVANISITFSDASTYSADPASVLHYNYVITRTWRATDVAGNFSECIQIITVHDITNPVITCPADVTIDCEDDNTPAGTGTATATDICTPVANISITFGDVSTYDADPASVLHYNYVITRTWRATDVAGNFSECIQTITVHDVTAPDFTVPATITICRTAGCVYDISTSVTGDVTNESDNCVPSMLLDATYTDDNSGLIDCDNFGYIIRTWTLTDIAGNTTSKIQTIWIEPVPTVAIVNNNPDICNSANVNLVISSPTISTRITDLSFVIAVSSNDPAHLGGTASTGFTLIKSDLPFTLSGSLTNSGDSPITVTYTATPKLNGCNDGPVQSVIVIVNPTPRIFPVPSNTIQCDSLTTSINLRSPSLFSSGFVTFKYNVTSTGGITGFAGTGSGLPNNHIITDNLINNTDHFQSLIYSVTPVSPTGCPDGPAQNITVTVNPTPRVIPNNIYPSICYAGTADAPASTQIVLTSPTVMTSGAVVFDYTVSVTGAIVGNTLPAVDRPLNHTISYAYQNNSDTIQSVFYSILPKVNNAICVPGRRVVSEIKVHARPLQDILVTKPFTCSGGAGLAALEAVISKGADPYHLVWDGPVGYHNTDSLEIANLSSGKYVVKVTDNLGCNSKDSINIVPVNSRPFISAFVITPGNYNISCIGSTDGRILIGITEVVTPPYTYRVIKNDTTTLFTGALSNVMNYPSDPSTYRIYNNLGAGKYTLLIRDANGCETPASITFRVPPPITAVLQMSVKEGGHNISCRGYNDGSAWVQTVAGGRGVGYTYSWYTTDGNIPGPVNTNRIDNLTAGTYYVEIRDILGCPQTFSTVVSEPEGMQLTDYQLSESPDGDFNVSCNGGNDGSISIMVTGGSGSYVYNWSGPDGFSSGEKDIDGLKAGLYICMVTDINDCILTPSPSFTLTEPTPMVISSVDKSTATNGSYNLNCYNGTTGWIDITVSGGSVGNYQYEWTTTDGSGLINRQEDQAFLTAGTYHVVVSDSNNCVATEDITLTQPLPLISSLSITNITCTSPGFDNGSIVLTVSGGIAPYSYLWSNGSTTKDLSGLTPGTYSVTITDLNGCTINNSAVIELPPPLSFSRMLSDYNGYNISCNALTNGFINVDPTSGTAPFVYSWTGPGGFTSSTKNITGIGAGTYSLLIVDSNECRVTETFEMTEPGQLGITYTVSQSAAGGYNISCGGDSTGFISLVPVNQVSPVAYLWSDGLYGDTRLNLKAGNYSIIVIDANNCQATETVNLTEPTPMSLSLNIVPPFCPDKPDGSIETIVAGGVRGADYYYQWSDNSTSKNLTNIPAGSYKVQVTDLNGCSVKDSVILEAENETCLVIPNAISPNSDLINDVWNIGLRELYPLMVVKVFNRWGEIVWKSENGYPSPWDGKSNGSPMPVDSYHYIIDLHNGSKPIVGNITIIK